MLLPFDSNLADGSRHLGVVRNCSEFGGWLEAPRYASQRELLGSICLAGSLATHSTLTLLHVAFVATLRQCVCKTSLPQQLLE
jgi:hypothetical protein